MASSKVVRSCLLAVLMLVAMTPPTHAQCDITLTYDFASIPGLRQFLTFIQRVGMSYTINEKVKKNVTFLAPNDAAILAFLPTLDALSADVTQKGSERARSILMYHIIPFRATVSQLKNGLSYPTSLTGYNLTVSKINSTSNTQTTTIVGNANNATVTIADQLLCNNTVMVHVINDTLLPRANLLTIPIYNENSATPASGLAIGTWTFVLSGALAISIMM